VPKAPPGGHHTVNNPAVAVLAAPNIDVIKVQAHLTQLNTIASQNGPRWYSTGAEPGAPQSWAVWSDSGAC
jgi:hypothetical protein